MSASTVHPSRHLGRGIVALTSALGLAAIGLSFAGTAEAVAPPILLGTAEQYAVLAGAGVTNTGPTTITTDDADVRGDVGTSPTDTITGDAEISWVLPATGSFHRADADAGQAQVDNLAAYTVAAGAPEEFSLGAQLDGVLLKPGVHTASTALDLAVGGTVTLDADGDEDAVFVIQVGSSLTLNSGSTVALTDGAQACRVFWQVGQDATIGTDAMFRGTMLAENAIVAGSGADIEGRLLAQVAAVSLNNNTFTLPGCTTADDDDDTDTDTDTDTDGADDTDGTDTGAGGDGDDTGAGGGGGSGGGSGPGTDGPDAGVADADGASEGTTSGGADSVTGTDADTDTSDLPDTGGSANTLVPVGVALVLLGSVAVVSARSRLRGTHRA